MQGQGVLIGEHEVYYTMYHVEDGKRMPIQAGRRLSDQGHNVPHTRRTSVISRNLFNSFDSTESKKINTIL